MSLIFFIIIIFILDTDEELKEWQSKFEERIATLESTIKKMERDMEDEETKSSTYLQTINESMREIGKLQAEADVMCHCYILPFFSHFPYMISIDIKHVSGSYVFKA